MKRQIKQLPDQQPTDRVIVSQVGSEILDCESARKGDYAVLKLNFDHSELTPNRLVVVQGEHGYIAVRYDHEQMDCSEVIALVMRVDRVVWQHGKEDGEILDAGLIG